MTADTLVVDLDHALLRNTVQQERFWASIAQNWHERIAGPPIQTVPPDSSLTVATLPFNPETIAHLRTWRAAGGQTVLATAGDLGLAEQIAGHLGLFDTVIALAPSDADARGPDMTDLQMQFGTAAITYLGKAGRDAARIRDWAVLRPYLAVLRPHHWSKNILIFLPMLAARQFDGQTVAQASLAFVSFSLVASAVYILNDLLDLGADRAHPRKRNRAFAAGSIPLRHGPWLAGGLMLAGLALALVNSVALALLMLGYIALTSAYSLVLKRLILIDICALAGLYTWRILAGGAATGIPLSGWLLAFSLFFFLSLAAIKRQAELVDSATRGVLRANGRGYHVADLPIVAMISIGSGYLAVLVLGFYVNSPVVTALYTRPAALWGACAILLYWITRAILVAHRGQMIDDPIVYAAKDRSSQIALALIFGFVVWAAME